MSHLENWQEEKSSAYLYALLAQYEKNPNRKALFGELGALANKQAALWEQELQKTGYKHSLHFCPSARTRLVGHLIKWLGIKPLRFILSAMKIRGMSVFLNIDPRYPFQAPSTHHEHRHKGLNNANNLRAAIFGVNDGLISNMSLLLGVVGAASSPTVILLTGIAGLLAGASSMAAGEYISVRSQREFFEYQITLEREELEQYPQEEAAELAAIYHARGLPKIESTQLAELMISDPEKALDVLAREELGLNPAELGSPMGAAVSSFLSFATGAFVPLLPFLFGNNGLSLSISIGLTGLTLFSIGAVLSLFTHKNAIKSGLRMLLIGASAGLLTYLIGDVVGNMLAL